MKILICGTPGTGKTTLSNKISKKFNFTHIDISKYIKTNNLYENYNEEFDTFEFDEEIISNNLYNFLKNKESFIIDTHSPSVAEKINFDLIFQIRSDFQTLRERFIERGYSNKKIEENVDCEAFNVVGEELEDYFPNQKIIYVNGCDYDLEDIDLKANEVIEFIDKKLIK